MRGAFVWIVLAVLVLLVLAFVPRGNGVDRDRILKRARAAKARYAKQKNENETVEENE